MACPSTARGESTPEYLSVTCKGTAPELIRASRGYGRQKQEQRQEQPQPQQKEKE